MTLRGLYAITPDHLGETELTSRLEAALQGGTQIVQYRAKQPDWPSKCAQGQRLMALCHDYARPFIVNEDIALARWLGADGIHLGQEDAGVAQARASLDAATIIGVTCHSNVDAAHEAQSQGADYVAFGRFFPSVTKPEAPPAPLATLDEAKARLSVPIVAIGGVTPVNAPQLVARGADMVAVINGLFGSERVREAAEAMARLFD